MVNELRKELLGPRDGINEILPSNQVPSDEYVLGVLVPIETEGDSDPDSENELISGSEAIDDDISDAGNVVIPWDVSPALNPKLRPRSLGISFVAVGNNPLFDVCITWARYKKEEGKWKRTPHFMILEDINTSYPGAFKCADDKGATLRIRSRRRDNQWRVNVFFVNETSLAEKSKPSEEEKIFQPEIRVKLKEGANLSPMAFRGMKGDPESQSQALLYRKRRHYARGHLVGVYWKTIDPQRKLEAPEGESPFLWEDKVVLTYSQDQERFSNCDLRTDYLPMYAVAAPRFMWLNKDPFTPQLHAARLSEMWDPKELKDALSPLVDGYENYLNSLKSEELPNLDAEFWPSANSHIQAAQSSCTRMRKGLSILVDDKKVRLAFCFMNRVMHLQRLWVGKEKKGLEWRPFQMAFILQSIEGIVNPIHEDRKICDLLWFPTGGGKTESYLGLAVLVLALRRLGIPETLHDEISAGGTSVISRYTLRLLTIQQFRRALICVTAAELLRVEETANGRGWRPITYEGHETLLWGGMKFSLGLWVGSSVTPNSLSGYGVDSTYVAGALDILKGMKAGFHLGTENIVQGDPAQILECPCCGIRLSIGDDGLGVGHHRLAFILRSNNKISGPKSQILPKGPITLKSVSVIRRNRKSPYYSMTLDIELSGSVLPDEFDEWFHTHILPSLGSGVTLASTSATRPGYFIRTCPQRGKTSTSKEIDFEIRCPDWNGCDLNKVKWYEEVPVPTDSRGLDRNDYSLHRETIPQAFQLEGNDSLSFNMPIPAFTVDDQIYHRCPSMIVSTVDKFARLPFEPKGGAIFGNVAYYHSRVGYYRPGLFPGGSIDMPHPRGYSTGHTLHRMVPRFSPPALIIQDELHLIEGPLGSMVGIYETLIEELSTRHINGQKRVVKLVASTATIRMASEQVSSLFNGRKVSVFPSPLLDESDSFFSARTECHQMEADKPGRLYVGISAPGRAQTMVISRIWASLLQSPYQIAIANQSATDIDRFWSLIGYFNAIKELANTLALYRQDIPERISWRFIGTERPLDPMNIVTLSSLASSDSIPGMLGRLSQSRATGQAVDAAFATSMFGTGVDVSRLGLMVVHGQPKTTSAYIQATGRVGRDAGGLVVAFFPASRPRDLDHYENFVSYHMNLHRHVEPITVAPFSPHVLDRSVGPLAVGMLRNAVLLDNIPVGTEWSYNDIGPSRIATRISDREVKVIPTIFEQRNGTQPPGRRGAPGSVYTLVLQMIDKWYNQARRTGIEPFHYYEPSMNRMPRFSVILGDEHHERTGQLDPRIVTVYEKAPQSLRDVESTTTFGG